MSIHALPIEMGHKYPELATEHFDAVLEDGDETDLMLILRTLSKSFGGVQEIVRQTDVNAHTLYRTLSEKGHPELKTLSAILKAMGMHLAIQPLNHHAQHRAQCHEDRTVAYRRKCRPSILNLGMAKDAGQLLFAHRASGYKCSGLLM